MPIGGARRGAVFAPVQDLRLLRHNAYDALREAILLGNLPSGGRVVEAEVARQMGISRGPIREAIRQLEQDGLVEYRPHHGVLVAELTRERVLDAYTVRAHLESLAAELAVPRLIPDDLAELERLLARMDGQADDDDATGLLRTDVDFHRRICELSGNRVLLRLWTSVGPHAWTLFSGAQQVGTPLQTLAARHRAVLAALASGNPATAARFAREHILEVARTVIDHRFPRQGSDRSMGAASRSTGTGGD